MFEALATKISSSSKSSISTTFCYRSIVDSRSESVAKVVRI